MMTLIIVLTEVSEKKKDLIVVATIRMPSHILLRLAPSQMTFSEILCVATKPLTALAVDY